MKNTKKIIDDRIFFLDLLKAISITTVVFFHASSNLSDATKNILDILQSPFRFCVPVLLTISFLLLNRSLEISSDSPKWLVFRKRFGRLFIPISFWFCLATIITLSLNLIYDKNLHLEDVILLNLQGQIFWGGYFLIILLQSLPIIIIFHTYLNSFKNILKIISFQSIIFIICYVLFSGIFGQEIIEILCSLSRPVLFYWFVYISIGNLFQKKLFLLIKISQIVPIRIKLILIVLTNLLMIIENTYFHYYIHENCFYSNFEYLRFSCIFSVFVMFLCFASIQEDFIPPLFRRIVYILSKYSLGIFCINGIISKFLLPNFIKHLITTPIVDLHTALIIKFIVWPLLLVVSLSLSVVLEKIGLRKCVC